MAIKKIAIITEFATHVGGIEKSILELTKGLTARGIGYDIYCGLYDQSKTFPEFADMNVKAFINEKKPMGLNTLYLRRKFSKLKLEGYDGYVFFGFHSLAAAKNNHPNVAWEQGPLAYLYLDDDAGVGGGIKGLIKDIYLKYLRNKDQEDIKGVDFMFSLGPYAKRRLHMAYPGIPTGSLPQPVAIEKYNICEKGKYYLSLARLEKHVDKVILAFQKMPDKELHVYGSGTEEEKAHIAELAKGYPNIHIKGFAKEEDLPSIFGKCIAAIGINIEEDFTMGLMEAQASGKPSISINPSQDAEDVVEVPTGLLIRDASVENICKAVRALNPKKAFEMRFACKQKAKEYSSEHFVDEILNKLKPKALNTQ